MFIFTRPILTGWKTISRIRSSAKSGKTVSLRDYENIEKIITESPEIESFSEKQLSLTLSLLLESKTTPPLFAVESLVKRIQAAGTTLQGCNQFLGGLAKRGQCPDEFRPIIEHVWRIFESEFAPDCPNRELTNLYWAGSVLKIDRANKLLEGRKNLPELLTSMDCVDLSLLCASLVEVRNESLWTPLRLELLTRKKFTPRDVPSIMCSIACAGLGGNDRELILHLAHVVHRDKLMNARNAPAILWAIAACDSVYPPLTNQFVEMVRDGTRTDFYESMDFRRVSRAFSVTGELGRIESWLGGEKHSTQNLADSVLVWEFVTNELFESALKIYRSKPKQYWESLVEECNSTASQVYHLYIAHLLGRVQLDSGEIGFLKSLQSKFSDTEISSSTLHRQASDALKTLKIEHVSEYIDPKTGYSIDMYLPTSNVGIEVQGPSHFVTDLETGSSILRPADRLKHKALFEVSGMRMVQVTPWNFGPKIRIKNTELMKKLIGRIR
jgi:hypothetical protein